MLSKRVLQISSIILFLCAAAEIFKIAFYLLKASAPFFSYPDPQHYLYSSSSFMFHVTVAFSAVTKIAAGILMLRRSIVPAKPVVFVSFAIATALLSNYTLLLFARRFFFSEFLILACMVTAVLILSAVAYSGTGKTRALRITVGIIVLSWAFINLMYPYSLFQSALIIYVSFRDSFQQTTSQYFSLIMEYFYVGIPNFALLLLTGITALISSAKPKMARVCIVSAVLAAVSCCPLPHLKHAYDLFGNNALAFPAMGIAVCAVCIVSMLLREKPAAPAEENTCAE